MTNADNPIADQEALPQTEPARKSDDDGQSRSAQHHFGQPLDLDTE